MAHFCDMSDYCYYPDGIRPETKTVGWLSREHGFEKNVPSEHHLDLLWDFCTVRIVQMRGFHLCELCENPEHNHFRVDRNEKTLELGSAEIRVFGNDGTIYAAPNLIYHYVRDHGYRPPKSFLTALESSPRPPSQKYFDRLVELNLAPYLPSLPVDSRSDMPKSTT
jgi:hypothetical protein